MAVTIRDVAKEAGVSVSTVSRVINNKGVISDETRDHILKIMQELNYFVFTCASSSLALTALSVYSYLYFTIFFLLFPLCAVLP